MAGILSVLKSMRSALSDAASSNKQFSDSLESIKFNLAVAFQPILTGNKDKPSIRRLVFLGFPVSTSLPAGSAGYFRFWLPQSASPEIR